MPPVRVKLYGLVAVTRANYLRQMAAVVLALAVLLSLWFYLPPWPADFDPQDAPALPTWSLRILYNLPWIVLAFAALFALEAYVVLRRFARLEAQQVHDPKPC